jgi:hypothetical protein
MKSIIIGRESNQILFALDDEAIQKLIEKLQDFQKNKSEIRFPIETTGKEIDLVFVPFDIQDKRIQEFFKDKEEFEAINNLKRESSE